MSEPDTTKFEVERLRKILRQYDVCECGYRRHEHARYLTMWGERGLMCPGGDLLTFTLKHPADPLETVVDGRALSEIAEESE